MRIALVNHGTANEWGGGDSVQIQETAKRLKQRGHQVSIQNSDRPEIDDVDLVHIFNCRVYQSFVQQMATCRQAGKPVVVSPIWISIGRALWGSRGSVGLLEQAVQSETAAAGGLNALLARQLVVHLPNGTVDALGRGTVDLSWQQTIGSLLKECQGMLPNSWLELKALQTDLHWCGNRFDVAHYGVNPQIFLDADPEPFRRHTGIQQPFVMQAGRIEPAKNQAMLCWALRETNLPIVLIGASRHWPSYAQLCRSISGDRLTIIDHLPQEMLASAYAAAGVHCLISWMDTCGLVSLEASLSGTPLVGSSFGHELEYLENDAWMADPADPIGIRTAVEEAWGQERNQGRSLRMKMKSLERFNWENTTNHTESLYQDILS
ncbi:Distantly related to Glycosyltransferase of family GT4 [Synechococcus sp. WH 7803]|nr:Distantly related to Glycosyltransferase of family GT4 [Synechococcus sp. WH 7803]